MKEHDPDSVYRRPSRPGVGQILALTILYEIHDLHRFPSVQAFASYARLLTSAQASAGKRLGTGGRKIGNAHLKWAFSETAVLFLRQNPPGPEAVPAPPAEVWPGQSPVDPRASARPGDLPHARPGHGLQPGEIHGRMRRESG